jgi:hypothetical protein
MYLSVFVHEMLCSTRLFVEYFVLLGVIVMLCVIVAMLCLMSFWLCFDWRYCCHALFDVTVVMLCLM